MTARFWVVGAAVAALSATAAIAAPPQPPSPRVLFAPLVRTVAISIDLDPGLADALVTQESSYNPMALSSAGAMGLTQLMPATARAYGVRNPYDPTENVIAGLFHFRQLLRRYKDVRLALAAYHAGEPAVNAYKGVPPWPKTRDYVQRILARTSLTTPVSSFLPELRPVATDGETGTAPSTPALPPAPPSPGQADTSIDLGSLYPERARPASDVSQTRTTEPIVLNIQPPQNDGRSTTGAAATPSGG